MEAEFDTLRLREISGNERRRLPPPSSPLARQVRGRKKRGFDLRKTTFEAPEYIEHIESELQQVKEARHSPSTGNPVQEKLKILQAENKQLKEIISELEETFDERVKQAVEHKAAVEVEMRRKIRALEDELVLKENMISCLEHDREESTYDGSSIDALRAMIERLELEIDGLEEANRVVEKRNEALTGLLAQSPTRSHHGFELASPTRHHSRRAPRPKSMVVTKLSSSSPSTEQCQRPQAVQTSPGQSSTGYFSPNTVLKLGNPHPCDTTGEIDVRKVSDSESLDSGLGESCSARSPAPGGSRRSSIASHASASPSAWGLPLLMSPSNEKATVKQSKHRRTRRFESGSTQLKPLLLPTMAAEGNAFQTSYAATLYSSPIRREFSEQSLDPTASFLSQPFETPTQRPALPSKWISERALRALEGSSPSHFESFEDIIAQHDWESARSDSSPAPNEMPNQMQEENLQVNDSPSCADDTVLEGDVTAFLNHPESGASDEEMFSSLIGEASLKVPDQNSTWSDEHGLTPLQRQLSSGGLPEPQQSGENGLDLGYTSLRQLSAESSQELMPEPLFLPSVLSRATGSFESLTRRASITLVSCIVDDSPVPRKRQRSSDPDSCSFVMPTLCVNPTHETSGHEKPVPDTHVSPSKESVYTSPKSPSKPPPRPRSPLERLHKKTASPAPLTSVTIRTIFGTLTRYTTYVREIRRTPIALARRLIANAWHSNWKRLGKLSWWILGLFLGSGARAEQRGIAQGIGRDWDQHDGEAVAGHVCGQGIGAIKQERATSHEPLRGSSDERAVRFDELDPGSRTAGPKTKPKSARKEVPQNGKKQKTDWGKSLCLWGKFSIAIMLAVGGAVISGPEEMLRDCAERIPRRSDSMTPEQMAGEHQGREVPERRQIDTDVDNAPVIGTSKLADTKRSPVREPNRSSEVRDASGRPARSFSVVGAGPALGTVKREWSSLRAPSPARRRARAMIPGLAAGHAHIFGSLRGSGGWDRFDGNVSGKQLRSRTSYYSQSGDKIPRAQPDDEREDLGTLQWVQKLNIKDSQNGDDEQDAVWCYSKSGKRTRSLMS